MKKLLILIIALFFFAFSPIPPQNQQFSSFLKVIVPESDTSEALSSSRISASASPGSRAFINGTEVKVYSSGAFCGLVEVPVGKSEVVIRAESPDGKSEEKRFILIRQSPPSSLPKDPITIESRSIEPSRDIWLGKGELLEVKFKGSPGQKAFFDIDGVESGIPMTELPKSQTGGIEGMYAGRYTVGSEEEVNDAAICVRIKKNFWSSEKAIARGKASLLPRSLPRAAEISSPRAFLNAGLGGDRLGGAKLHSIGVGTKILIDGKSGEQLRVKLGESMAAWIPQSFVNFLPAETPLPSSLTGSISCSGNEKEDIVSLSLQQRLPFISEQLNDPAEIIVDIFGASSNTNWITHHRSGKGIAQIYWKQVGKEHFRLCITLQSKQHWGYDIRYESSSTLTISVRRPPVFSPSSPLAGMTIAVDAGHGGDARGALGSTGVFEKDINFSMAQHLEAWLKNQGSTVIMTRPADQDIPLGTRIETAVNAKAQLMVSIHSNSIGLTTDPSLTKGTSAYYRSIGFRPLADILYSKMLELDLAQFGLVGSFNFALNSPTNFPTALVETAFMSNPEDEILLMNDSFRLRAAEQIGKGIMEFVVLYGEKK